MSEVTKGVDERLMKVFPGGSVMWRGWRMIGLLREYDGSRSVDMPRKRWIDTMKDCLRKRSLNVRHARRIVQNRSEW